MRSSEARPQICTTPEVLEVRGARTRRVLEDDLHAGLFDDLTREALALAWLKRDERTEAS